MTPISGYLGAIAANGPVSLTMPSTITTAPAGITPDAPRRGSVSAYAPRMMMVSVIALHPRNSASPRSQAPGRIFVPPGSTPTNQSPLHYLRSLASCFQHDKREMHVPGKRYISGETFHTDHSNHPTPPKANDDGPGAAHIAAGDLAAEARSGGDRAA